MTEHLWRQSRMRRILALLLVAGFLAGCGFVPPVPLHGAPVDPDPSTTGIVYYGEVLHENLKVGWIGIRYADGDRVQTSERAVVVLPSGNYVFELSHPTGETMVTEIIDSNGTHIAVWEQVFETTPLEVAVRPGRCYRLFAIGDPSDKQYGYEDYWPADREDITPYCPSADR